MAEEKEEITKESEEKGPKKGGLLGWIVTFVVALGCAAGGYTLSGLFAKSAPPKVDPNEAERKAVEQQFASEDPSSDPWNFELQPITANLNVMGVGRLIQLTVVVEFSPKMDQEKGKEYVQKKTIHLRDWLGTYLASLNLDQVKGGTNQSRMKVEIRENFNQILFPDSTPHITRVMLKDVMIQ